MLPYVSLLCSLHARDVKTDFPSVQFLPNATKLSNGMQAVTRSPLVHLHRFINVTSLLTK